MIYFIEGVDKTGKSTASKKLAEKLGAEYQHYSKPDKDPSDYFFPAISAHLDGKDVVCDRYILGEKIYAKVKGTPSQWKEGAYEDMLLQLEKLHATLIVCWEYPKTVKQRFVELGEDFITPKQAMKVQNAFRREAKRIAEAYPGLIVMEYKPSSNLLRFISKMV